MTKRIKITKITELGNNMYAHECPICGAIVASSCEAQDWVRETIDEKK